MRTNAGLDMIARVISDPGSNGTGNFAPATWMALSSDATAPAAGNTTLAGELTGGTMGRVQGAYAHTNGTNSRTLVASFTADRTVNVYKYALFTASTAGTMVFSNLFDEMVGLKAGDVIQVIDTVTF